MYTYFIFTMLQIYITKLKPHVIHVATTSLTRFFHEGSSKTYHSSGPIHLVSFFRREIPDWIRMYEIGMTIFCMTRNIRLEWLNQHYMKLATIIKKKKLNPESYCAHATCKNDLWLELKLVSNLGLFSKLQLTQYNCLQLPANSSHFTHKTQLNQYNEDIFWPFPYYLSVDVITFKSQTTQLQKARDKGELLLTPVSNQLPK